MCVSHVGGDFQGLRPSSQFEACHRGQLTCARRVVKQRAQWRAGPPLETMFSELSLSYTHPFLSQESEAHIQQFKSEWQR